MRRSTKMLMGVTIALITAASLHFTVGNRFHERAFGRFGGGRFCNSERFNEWKKSHRPADSGSHPGSANQPPQTH